LSTRAPFSAPSRPEPNLFPPPLVGPPALHA
jgi:hypothetical protein